MTTASIILDQLGGGRFCFMTGAKNLIDHGDGLSFKVMKNALGVTHVKVVLTPADLYDVEYLRVWGVKVTTKAHDKGIYFDMLRDSFERNTGLYTSL